MGCYGRVFSKGYVVFLAFSEVYPGFCMDSGQREEQESKRGAREEIHVVDVARSCHASQ